MSKKEMRRFVENSIASGYRHHSYDLEKKISDFFLMGKGDSSLGDILNLHTYEDILAPDRLRAAKNSLICLVTVMSRSAINDGADAEVSFSMSDYFLNEIERQQGLTALQTLLEEIICSFRELVYETRQQKYSLRTARALRYIHGHIYGSCTVADAAAFAGCSAHYLSALFQKEIGLSPKAYISQRKLKEARSLLLDDRNSVQEIASLLGYSSSSHFIREFKSVYGVTPGHLEDTR